MVNKRQADVIGKRLGVDFKTVDREQFRQGITREAGEHRDVTRSNHTVAAKIALSHLREIPDYYTRLHQMERDARQESRKESKRPGRRAR